MKSILMSENVDAAAPPSLLALGAAHVLIGLMVGVLTKAVFKQSVKVAIVAGFIAVGLHYNFDAPLARKLSALESALQQSKNPVTQVTAEMDS